MGFDVSAFYTDAGSEISSRQAIEAAFADAEVWLKENAGGYDSFISLGSLDCGQSITFLERAIGYRFKRSKGGIWLPEEVRQFAEMATWPDPDTVRADERWAYWSARKFLEVCVQHGLGIWTV